MVGEFTLELEQFLWLRMLDGLRGGKGSDRRLSFLADIDDVARFDVMSEGANATETGTVDRLLLIFTSCHRHSRRVSGSFCVTTEYQRHACFPL